VGLTTADRTALPCGSPKPNPDNLTAQKVQSVDATYTTALKNAYPNISLTAQTLLEAQTTMEGFFKGSISFTSNNPGNVNTYLNKDGTAHINKYNTLEEGIKAQYGYISQAVGGASAYKIGRQVCDEKYDGSLYQYLGIYSTGGLAPDNNYLNFVVNYFKSKGITITGRTKMSEIWS
jgi:hypothetical protein